MRRGSRPLGRSLCPRRPTRHAIRRLRVSRRRIRRRGSRVDREQVRGYPEIAMLRLSFHIRKLFGGDFAVGKFNHRVPN